MRKGAVMACAALLWAVAAGAETRLALVIGNDRYATLPDLNNAGRDARRVAQKLAELGFETTLERNITRRALHRELARFEAELRRSDVGLVYYAGHGIQTGDGRNYLIPADAQIEREADLRAEAVRTGELLELMERAGSGLNIVILDACRDNPLPEGLRTARRGLALEVVPAGIRGTAILYAAGPGQAAEDGPPGGHGVFTGELLEALEEPGLTLEEVFKRIVQGVSRRTNGRQRPWNMMSLEGDFYFNPGAAAVAGSVAAAGVRPSGAGGGVGEEVEVVFWESVDRGNEAELEAYLREYPSGRFAELARARLARLAAGDAAAPARSDSVEMLNTLLTSRGDPCNVRPELVELRLLIESLFGTIDFELLSDSVVSRTNRGEIFDPKSDVVDPKIAALFSNVQAVGNVYDKIRQMRRLITLTDVEEVIPQETEILLDVSEQLGSVIPRVAEALERTAEELEDVVEGYRASVKEQKDPQLSSILNDKINAAASDLDRLRLWKSNLEYYDEKTNDSIYVIERYHQVLLDFSNCIASQEGTRSRSSISLRLRAQTEIMEQGYKEFISKVEMVKPQKLEDQFLTLISEGNQLCSHFNVYYNRAIEDTITELDQTIAKQERRRSEIGDETLSWRISDILEIHAKDRRHVLEMQRNWDLAMLRMAEDLGVMRDLAWGNEDSTDNQDLPVHLLTYRRARPSWCCRN